MKRFDLMFGINVRGTFAASQACIPHLLKSENPHILNIASPLNMNPAWFAGSTAYTMAKYGMSMCVLGMAEEFREQGLGGRARGRVLPLVRGRGAGRHPRGRDRAPRLHAREKRGSSNCC